MKNNPKEKKTGDQYLGFTSESQENPADQDKKFLSILNADAGLIAAGIIQIISGLSIVGVSILGLLNPLWLSAIMSLVGSISSMFGVYLIFHAIAVKGNFDTLINQSIKRVIRDQN